MDLFVTQTKFLGDISRGINPDLVLRRSTKPHDQANAAKLRATDIVAL